MARKRSNYCEQEWAGIWTRGFEPEFFWTVRISTRLWQLDKDWKGRKQSEEGNPRKGNCTIKGKTTDPAPLEVTSQARATADLHWESVQRSSLQCPPSLGRSWWQWSDFCNIWGRAEPTMICASLSEMSEEHCLVPCHMPDTGDELGKALKIMFASQVFRNTL